MALMFSDSCDLSLYDNGKWAGITPISGDFSRIQFLPTGGINGGGAYKLNADNNHFDGYFGYMLSWAKNYITIDFSRAAAETTQETLTRISFWMKCEPNFATSVIRTMPFMILDNASQYQGIAGNYYYSTGLPLFLDTNGQISVRQRYYSLDNYGYYISYNSYDYLRGAGVVNEHIRLDDQNWHHIEIAIAITGIDTSKFTLHIDGNLYATYNGDLTQSYQSIVPRTFDLIRFMSAPDMNLIYDDIIIWQDVPNTDYTGYKGPTKIYSVVASANSTPSDAIPSEGSPNDKWTLVGGVPYNNSWTLNQTWVTLPVGGKELYEMSNVSFNETIQAVSYTMNYASTYKPPNVSVPGIVTSGLVLHLDAANTYSFPAGGSTSGTVWYDISGTGKHANFVNTPTYNSISGCFDLDFADYFVGTQSFNAPFSLPTGSNPRTIITGFRTPNSNSIGDVLHVFHYGATNTSQASGIMLIDQFGNNVYYVSHHGWNDNPYVLNYPLQISKDYVVAIRYDNTLSPKFRGFINGTFENLSADSILNTSTSQEYHVASRISPTEYLQPSGSSGARIYFVMVYDRALSDAEIQQVYDTMKIRYPELSSITNYANVRPILVSNGVTYNGTTRSGTTSSYSTLTEYLFTDFGSGNTNWTANSVSSLIAGFENIG